MTANGLYTRNMVLNDSTAREAANHLAGCDPVLAAVISRVGICTIRPHRNYYQELVDAIVSQQLSIHAAHAIENRLRDMFGGTLPTPAQILEADQEALRSLGLSRPKVAYIRDLASHVAEGRLVLDQFDDLSNDAISAELTAVKGIGEWTAHMFLIFCMGRTDVLPVGDLGIKNGIKALYGFSTQPTADDIRATAAANHWHPFESIASWYVWQSMKTAPAL